MKNEYAWGMASAVFAFSFWGLLPIYWKLMRHVPSMEILAHRFIWSLFFMVLVILLTKRTALFRQETRAILAQPRKALGVMAAAGIITINWLIYIWAVNDNRIVETSLGYYINPLVNVVLGIVVLKERLAFWQAVSVTLAAIGVTILTVSFGTFPWVALSLALAFGLYGLCKKLLGIGAVTSITLETLLISPLALLYLSRVHGQGAGTFGAEAPLTTGLLVGAGLVTVIPMVLFSYSAIRLPLSVLGFTQYLSPTIALFVGVFLYHETFSVTHAVSFGFIWLALVLFSCSGTRTLGRLEAAIRRKPFGQDVKNSAL